MEEAVCYRKDFGCLRPALAPRTSYNLQGPFVVEAEKLHDLPSASWRTRITSGVVQSESKGLIITG